MFYVLRVYYAIIKELLPEAGKKRSGENAVFSKEKINCASYSFGEEATSSSASF